MSLLNLWPKVRLAGLVCQAVEGIQRAQLAAPEPFYFLPCWGDICSPAQIQDHWEPAAPGSGRFMILSRVTGIKARKVCA